MEHPVTCELGAFLSTPSAANAEVLGQVGFDFLLIDLEHGLCSEADVPELLRAIGNTLTLPFVRVESHAQLRAGRVLDMGARGIMFPRVDTADQARACVAAMRYPPEGIRGMAANVRASRFGTAFADYRASAPRTILQIETAEAVRNVEEIAEVEGADVLFVGPNDLSNSMGIFRQFDHPDYRAALDRVVAACRRRGRAAGILIPTAEEAGRYRDLGFHCLMCGSDVAFLQSAAVRTLGAMRVSVG
jgi:4-hydroxy-2-oxoheptanedioate aldolase